MIIIEKSNQDTTKVCNLQIHEQILEDENLSHSRMISVHQQIFRIHLEYMGQIS